MSVHHEQISFKSLKDKWPSTFVARCKIAEFTGGIISPGSLANADSEGTGPTGAFKYGRKQVYPVDSIIEWMERRARQPQKTTAPKRK